MPLEVISLSHIYMPGSPFESTAVREVTLKIDDGEFVGLIGHTGSGKSTLVQHLNGLLKPSSGKVLMDGVDIHDKETKLRDIRRAVGLVFQYPEYQLFEETVSKDIAFGPRNLGLSEVEITERVREACELVGLRHEDIGERSPFELSGGQKRRVAIAGVLAMRPRVLALDEPTAGLDPRGREELLSLIGGMYARGGLTVIMVSHSMDDVARMARRIVVMKHGAVALDGTPEDVFAHGNELTEMGLGLPEAVRLRDALRQRGWDVPETILHLPDMRDYLVQKLAGKGEAHA